MSYLASIVARANGSTPLLQPRIASPYEHDLGGADRPPEVTVERVAPAGPMRPASSAHVDGAAGADPLPHAEPALLPRTTFRTDEPTSRRDPILPRDPSAQPERIVARKMDRFELHENVIRTAASGTTPTRTATRPSAESAGRGKPAVELREQVSTVISAAPTAMPPVNRRAENDRREEPPVDRSDGREPGEEAPLRALLRPPPLPAQPAAGERRVPAPVAPGVHESAPTIRVTIGRVDVRAVEPQSSSRPAPAARTPAFTLDDYVRLRKEGRR